MATLKDYVDAVGHSIHTLAKRVHDLESREVPPWYNYLTNPNMEIWQRGTGPFINSVYNCDAWQGAIQSGSTISVSQNTANSEVPGGYCAAVTYTHGGNVSFFLQAVERVDRLRGGPITFSIRAKGTVAAGVQISIWDGFGRWYGVSHSGSGNWETLAITLSPLRADATVLQVEIALQATGTYYFDNAVLVQGGKMGRPYPLNPADDMMRCLRRYQVWGGSSLFEGIFIGFSYGTTTALGVLPFQGAMGGTPTMSYSALSHFACYTPTGSGLSLATMTFPYVGPKNATIYFTTTTAGMVAGSATELYCNNTLSARIIAEWNP